MTPNHLLILRRLLALWAAVILAVAPDLTAARAQPDTPPQTTVPSAAAGPIPVAADLAATNLAILPIKGPIDRITALSVKRRLDAAVRAGADTIVLEIDTPGGELGAVLEICDLIEQSPAGKIFAWINTTAYSGGAIIAMACDRIIVNDTASFGDALPVAMSFGMLNALPEAERQKALVPLLAQVVYSARKHGYDEYLAQAIVSRNVELWLVEDTSTGKRWCIDRAEYRVLFGDDPPAAQPRLVSAKIAPGAADARARAAANAQPSQAPTAGGFRAAAPQLQTLASKVVLKADVEGRRPVFTPADAGRFRLLEYVSDGNGPVVLKAEDLAALGFATNTTPPPPGQTFAAINPAVRTDADLQSFTGAKNIQRFDQRWSESLIGILTSWPVRAVLVVIMLVAMFIEMTHPGVLLPGAVAGLALLGLIAPPLLIGLADWLEISAILLGIFLLLLEVFVVPGFGVPGALGLLLLIGGLIATFIPDASPFPGAESRSADTMYGLVTVVAALLTSGVLMYYISKNFGSLPIASKLVLRDPTASEQPTIFEAAAPVSDAGPRAGDLGVTITPLRPSGRVQIDDAIYDVVADMGYIPAGASVRVVSVGEFRITVEPFHADEAPRPPVA